MFGLVSFFPIENVIATGAGQGISGILMTIIRYVILLTLNPETSINLSAYIFFGISSFIILIIIRKIMLLYQNEYFLSILIKIGEIKSNEKNDNLIENEKEEELKDLDKINEENNNDNKEKEKNFGIFYLILKIFDINFFVILCFVVTIGLFPGVSIRPNLFGMSIGWKINTIIFLFNLFDTFGRKLLAYVKKPTKFLLYFVSFLRLIFLFTFPLVIYLEKYVIHNQNIIGILAVLNVSLMALSSGFVVNLCFSLAPEQVENNLKAKAGSCVSLCLSIGLFFGAFAANVINNIINKF
jgi:ABC-type multidrug transport system fused ATPase/permease subunit